MAGLNVHAIKSSHFGQACTLNKCILHMINIVIGNDAILTNGCILFKNRIIVSDQGFWYTIRLTVASRMGRLHDNQRLKPTLFESCFLNVCNEALEFIQVLFIDVQLTRVCPSFLKDCGCFKPNQTGTTSCKAIISAYCQLIWRSIQLTIAPFHCLASQTILYCTLTYSQGSC